MKYLFFYTFLFITFFSNSQNAETIKRKKEFNIAGNAIGISGYDPLSYFLGNPKKGVKDFNGVVYYFASQTNLELFKKSPAKYEPAYGGWCAYAMGASGEKVEIDSKTYKIIDGKLYLFYNSFLNNTLPKWNKEEVSLKNKADKNWQIFYK